VGSVDGEGQPWASIVFGEPGFLRSPEPRTLDVDAELPAGDPLLRSLHAGAALGLLGIQPQTRRRNRMNGAVEQVHGTHFRMHVVRSFGNCPKYIQARTPERTTSAAAPHCVRGTTLDAHMQRMINGADTFFIATAVVQEDGPAGRPHGADVSHRGGKPGFVRIDDDRTLTAPDFIGNFLFNTIGNLQLHPRAGLLFIDYATGDLLYLAVDADVIWDGPEVASFAGAQRLLRFHVRETMLLERGLPFRWSEAEFSPALERTGSWTEND
ncbi:flavin-nucleotide-binding protein, partial [Oxalobacteraceae bacterium OM1]